LNLKVQFEKIAIVQKSGGGATSGDGLIFPAKILASSRVSSWKLRIHARSDEGGSVCTIMSKGALHQEHAQFMSKEAQMDPGRDVPSWVYTRAWKGVHRWGRGHTRLRGRGIRGALRDLIWGAEGKIRCMRQGGHAWLRREAHRGKGALVFFYITSGYTLTFEVYICRCILIYELWITLVFYFVLLTIVSSWWRYNDGKKLPTPRIFDMKWNFLLTYQYYLT
jgi:hypothetical protein